MGRPKAPQPDGDMTHVRARCTAHPDHLVAQGSAWCTPPPDLDVVKFYPQAEGLPGSVRLFARPGWPTEILHDGIAWRMALRLPPRALCATVWMARVCLPGAARMRHRRNWQCGRQA